MEAFENWVIIWKYTTSKTEELNLHSPTREQKTQRVVMVLSEIMTKARDVSGDHDIAMF